MPCYALLTFKTDTTPANVASYENVAYEKKGFCVFYMLYLKIVIVYY